MGPAVVAGLARRTQPNKRAASSRDHDGGRTLLCTVRPDRARRVGSGRVGSSPGLGPNYPDPWKSLSPAVSAAWLQTSNKADFPLPLASKTLTANNQKALSFISISPSFRNPHLATISNSQYMYCFKSPYLPRFLKPSTNPSQIFYLYSPFD